MNFVFASAPTCVGAGDKVKRLLEESMEKIVEAVLSNGFRVELMDDPETGLILVLVYDQNGKEVLSPTNETCWSDGGWSFEDWDPGIKRVDVDDLNAKIIKALVEADRKDLAECQHPLSNDGRFCEVCGEPMSEEE